MRWHQSTSKQSAALNGFVDIFKQLSKSGVTEEEVEAVRTKALADFDHPEYEIARLPRAAVDLLTGQRLFTVAELAEQLLAVTAGDVLAVAGEAYANALLQVPYGVSAGTIGFAAAPTMSGSVVTGQRHSSRSDDGSILITGRDGISIINKAGRALTVRFADCAVRLRWPDGGNILIAKDGISVTVEPTLYRVDDTALAILDQGVPDNLTVPMPQRRPDHIPQPQRRGPGAASCP